MDRHVAAQQPACVGDLYVHALALRFVTVGDARFEARLALVKVRVSILEIERLTYAQCSRQNLSNALVRLGSP